MLNKLNEEIKKAMKARDMKRLSTLRGLMAAAKNIAIDDSRKEASDEDVLASVTKGLKQRADSVEQYKNAGRDDLVEVEEFEIAIYKEFQPEQMGEEEVAALVEKVISDTGAESKKDMGKVMGALMPLVKGKADGKLVSKIVGMKLT